MGLAVTTTLTNSIACFNFSQSFPVCGPQKHIGFSQHGTNRNVAYLDNCFLFLVLLQPQVCIHQALLSCGINADLHAGTCNLLNLVAGTVAATLNRHRYSEAMHVFFDINKVDTGSAPDHLVMMVSSAAKAQRPCLVLTRALLNSGADHTVGQSLLSERR